MGSQKQNTLDLTLELLRRRSVTPDDAGCQRILSERLESSGFSCTPLRFGEVDNLWALRSGNGASTSIHPPKQPLLVFAGHTDVVPTGPVEEWRSLPFEPEVRDGYLYARGAADMKASLAAMTIAAENFLNQHPFYSGSLAFLITSDEEGPAKNGTRRVVEYLKEQNVQIDYCVVGEPSSSTKIGDTIRNGRRGSLSGELKIKGKQGHVAYPHLAINPIHQAIEALNQILQQPWSQADAYFPATSLQFSNIHAGTGVGNVIPGELTAAFNFRFNPTQSAEQLIQITENILRQAGLNFSIQWSEPGPPFITPEGTLTRAVELAILDACGAPTCLSTSGGTSDGRFIAPTGASVVEFGPVNATIHMVDECVRVDDLPVLSQVYQNIMENLLVAETSR